MSIKIIMFDEKNRRNIYKKAIQHNRNNKMKIEVGKLNF